MIKELGNEYIKSSKKEILVSVLKAITVVMVLNYFFYQSILAILPLSIVGFMFFIADIKETISKKRMQALKEFKELLILSTTGLKAGYSVENAMINSYQDLKNLFGVKSFICTLLYQISVAKNNNQSISDNFRKAGSISKLEDVQDFGEIYEIAYTKSGNMSVVMEKCARLIVEKIDIKNQIMSDLNERIFETKIMNLMPFLIMLYINLTSRDYFDVMYHNLRGIVIMTILLTVYILAYVLSMGLIRIEV